jgi:alcohol dehydrogenase/L-iditol 2-dehydrogenase
MQDLAVVNFAPDKHSVELREIPRATIRDDEVLVEVQAVGVCGSDLHMWTGQQSWPMKYPVVLGHEFCGVIRELGRGVSGWKEGERVVSETAAVVDPNSPLTREGRYNLDPNRRGYGAVVDGAMRRYVPVPQRILHRMPDGLAFEQAALTEPCCVAFNAVVNNAHIRPGDRIVVLGPGPIGVLCSAIARLCGAEVAIVGCDATAWSRDVDGLGADGVVDATGVSVALSAALDLVRPGGWISKVGWGPQPVGFSLDRLVQKNITLQGSFSHNWPIWERVIHLIASGALDVRPITGGIWPIAEWHEAFETMHSGRIVKAILKP